MQGGNQLRRQPKDLNNFGKFAQFLVQIMACWAQLGFRQGGPVAASERKGGNFQNFESVNQMSKVDVKSDKSFLLFSQAISRYSDPKKQI